MRRSNWKRGENSPKAVDSPLISPMVSMPRPDHPLACHTQNRKVWQLAILLLGLLTLLLHPTPSWALEPIIVDHTQKKIDITEKGQLYRGRGDRLQIETAAGDDGIPGRMVVHASTRGTDPNWVVFALKNPTDKTIVRWLIADRYTLSGSKIFNPDLDSARIIDVTPSLGFKPERVPNKKADVFRITVEPGATTTFVAELSSLRFPRIYLWRVNPYINHRYDITLFSGILLGITGILAIYLTTIFAANHQLVFPAAAFLAWSILSYLCVDFGFWHKLFNLHIEDNGTYRAASEAAIVAGLIGFLYAFLRLNLWHRWIKWVFGLWFVTQLLLLPLAVLDAALAASLARLSYLPLAVGGSLLIAFLAINGQERALSLLPTWLLFLVWMFAAAVTIEGHLTGEIIASALNAGLVLILALLTFTATQFAFRGSDQELSFGAPRSQLQLRALAIEGADSAVWEWQPRRDEISVGTEVEDALGLSWGTLSTRVKDWLKFLHPADRERFRLILIGIEERNGGDIDVDFRMRRSDGTYLWFGLKAHSIDHGQSRALRCVGLMRDITDAKRAQERLMHDAVHDSLTGLPNRALFLDRLSYAVTRVREENATNPTLMFIDIDRFKNVNQSYGFVVGDSMLLTVARRLSRHLKPQDTLARIGGDQFGILVVSESNPQNIAMLAERIRRALRSPMKIGGDEIILTSSIGIAIYDGRQNTPEDLLREAELAMYFAKRSGTDRIELFNQSMTQGRDDRVAFESELRQALQRNQMTVSYQPIMRLGTNELAGFEALLRWEHPKFGLVNPAEFIPIAEESDFIGELGTFVLERSVQAVRTWHTLLPRRDNPLFVSVNVSSRQIFRRELVQDIRHIMGRQSIPPGTLRLEITESLVMENPEQAAEILDWLRTLGASLSLDDFGTGYSSLAYLHRLPFDTLKIDKTLVQNRGMHSSGLAILKSIVALAHELDKDVVAEGVEFEEDVIFLRSINCDFAQGFYFGEPIPEHEVGNVLRALAQVTQTSSRSSATKKTSKIKKARADHKKATVTVTPGKAQTTNQTQSVNQAPGVNPMQGMKQTPSVQPTLVHPEATQPAPTLSTPGKNPPFSQPPAAQPPVSTTAPQAAREMPQNPSSGASAPQTPPSKPAAQPSVSQPPADPSPVGAPVTPAKPLPPESTKLASPPPQGRSTASQPGMSKPAVQQTPAPQKEEPQPPSTPPAQTTTVLFKTKKPAPPPVQPAPPSVLSNGAGSNAPHDNENTIPPLSLADIAHPNKADGPSANTDKKIDG